MTVGSETLDRIARSGEAVFATDAGDRIILWNKKCEELLERPARSVLGRRCYDIVGGRDAHGNLYCHRSCPVAFQARERTEEPINRFTLSVEVGDKGRRNIEVSMFAIPSYHPALATLVHVLREGGAETLLEKQLSGEAEVREPLWPMTTGQGESVVLTKREKEILRYLAQGLSTGAVAKQLSISMVTVRNHTAKILQRLGVHTKLAAVVFSYQHGLLEPAPAAPAPPQALPATGPAVRTRRPPSRSPSRP